MAALLLLAAFLTQTFTRGIIIIDYYANMSRYALHCENKARPMMHCHGKCQMMEKMRQEEKKDQENPENRSENKNEIALSSKSFFAAANFQPLFENRESQHTSFHIGSPVDRSLAIFHPPAV
ncbi:MAG TPA: hypothetical protein VG890_14490 [Puia sp.]|nr:hypothetical protein [Puia sp.]